MQIFFKFFLFFFVFLCFDALKAQQMQGIAPKVQVKPSTISRKPTEMLRLAYLREQKENFVQALFYLNLYALTTHDTEAIPPIEQLAARYRLLGYEHNDLRWVQMKYRQYFPHLLIAILSIWGGVCGYWLYIMWQGGKVLSRYKLIWVFTLLLWLGVFNFYQENKLGIIADEDVYLMEAPSAGSPLFKIVGKGHRVTILGEQDIWYKIQWQNKTAFVRKNCVWELSL